MVSDKLNTMVKTLQLAADAQTQMPKSFMAAMARSLAGIRDEVKALEGAQVAKAQRLTPEHMNANVHLFPMAARREAQQR